MWKQGSIKVGSSTISYWVKSFEEGSQFGIDKGRISKLMLKRDGRVIANYDRGWDIKPADPDTQLAVDILLHGENY